MKIPFVVLGAGIVGRFAKTIIPEAVIFEQKEVGERFTFQYLGANWCKLPVPELKYKELKFMNFLNGEVATITAIKDYKELKTGTRELDYGDIKQFTPEQTVYDICAPDVPVEYGHCVQEIDINTKTIKFTNGRVVEFGCIISTIPLSNLMKVVNIWKGVAITNIDAFFLAKRTIFYKEEIMEESIPDGVCKHNSITDKNSLFYRELFVGNRRSQESYIEFPGSVAINPGKILPSKYAEEIAKDLQLYGIYCYGRYARWRPKEHLHETFKNLRRFAERKGQIGYC